MLYDFCKTGILQEYELLKNKLQKKNCPPFSDSKSYFDFVAKYKINWKIDHDFYRA